ncbi:MAG: hypothetical protein KAW12_18120, partial [Candidatus Aminicenantes bacterium]|nr:hypothetical protein [Candidatus Aminicenantes bacterium]
MDRNLKDSINTADAYSDDCIFCRIGSHNSNSLPGYDRPVLQTADFFVIPAMGQFIEGYVLICPREHFINLSVMDKELYSRFLDVKKQVKSLLYEAYGQHYSAHLN